MNVNLLISASPGYRSDTIRGKPLHTIRGMPLQTIRGKPPHMIRDKTLHTIRCMPFTDKIYAQPHYKSPHTIRCMPRHAIRGMPLNAPKTHEWGVEL